MQVFADAARAQLVSITSNSIVVSDGARFPVANRGSMPDSLANTWFKLVLAYLDDYEICYVCTHTGNGVFTDVLRGQEGSTQREWPVDHLQTTAFIAPVAADMAYFLSAIKTLQDGKVDKAAGKVLSSNDFTNDERVKLTNIAEQATKNATDAALRDRATHTGTQAIATVTGLQSALDSKLSSSGGLLSGNLTVPSLNGGQLAGMRNKIINGSFRVWQRGTSGFAILGSQTYTADRWFAVAAGATLSAYATAYNSGYASSLVINGEASNTMCDIGQRIEGVNTEDLAGKVVTLSCEVFRSTAGSVTWEARYANSVDNFTTTTLISSGTIAVTGDTFTFAAVNFTVPLAFAHHGIEIRFKYGALTATKQAALRRVQLEVGEVATPFEHRPYGVELAMCQRYYCKTYNTEVAPATIASSGEIMKLAVGSNIYDYWGFPTAMRAVPTVTLLNPFTGATGTWQDGTNSSIAVGVANPGMSGTGFFLNSVNTGALVRGHIVASAEL